MNVEKCCGEIAKTFSREITKVERRIREKKKTTKICKYFAFVI
jgi:hypothetical protein